MADESNGGDVPIIVKKYANRRLYNTETSNYVTLADLARMVKDGAEFIVHDARTGEDITRAVLTQIVVEEEAKGPHLLPIGFLRQLIAFYGDSLQGLVPQYLEGTMRSFTDNQEQIRDYLNGAFDGMFPFGQIEEMNRRNMQMFEQAVNMLSPEHAPSADNGGDDSALDEMKTQLIAMQRQIDELSRKKNA